MKLTFKISLILGIIFSFSKATLALPIKPEPVLKFPSTLPMDYQAQLSDNSDFYLQLLVKAIRQFLVNNPYEMESQLNITGEVNGAKITFFVQIDTINQAPNKFSSHIKFTNAQGIVGKEYRVISNGRKVWIYNISEEIYSVTDYESFQDSQDSFLIGMLSSLFLEIWQDTEDLETIINISEEELLETLKSELDFDPTEVNFKSTNLEGKPYAAYTYKDKEEGFIITAFIDPSTKEIEHLHINGSEDEWSFLLKEEVIKKNTLQSIPLSTFEFLIPINARESSEPISIEPY